MLANHFFEALKGSEINEDIAIHAVKEGLDLDHKRNWINVTGRYIGIRPIHAAVIAQAINVVEVLAKQMNISFDKADEQGQTPLHFSVLTDNDKLVRIVLAGDPSIACQTNHDGELAIHLAIKAGKTIAALTLINEMKADNLNITDRSGNTPFLLSIKHGHYELASAVLNKGVNVRISDKLGNDALRVLRQQQPTDMIKDLITKITASQNFQFLCMKRLHEQSVPLLQIPPHLQNSYADTRLELSAKECKMKLSLSGSK